MQSYRPGRARKKHTYIRPYRSEWYGVVRPEEERWRWILYDADDVIKGTRAVSTTTSAFNECDEEAGAWKVYPGWEQVSSADSGDVYCDE